MTVRKQIVNQNALTVKKNILLITEAAKLQKSRDQATKGKKILSKKNTAAKTSKFIRR